MFIRQRKAASHKAERAGQRRKERHQLAADEQHRADRGSHRAKLEDRILNRLRQGVEAADQVGDPLHAAANHRRQEVRQRNTHLFKAAAHFSQIALEIVAHDPGHIAGSSASGIHARRHCIQRVRTLLECGKDALDRLVAKDRHERGVALALGHALRSCGNIADDLRITSITAIAVSQRYTHIADHELSVLGVVLHVAQHGVERRTTLTALDACIGQHAHRRSRILKRHAKGVSCRRSVLHGLAEPLDRRVGVCLCVGEDVSSSRRFLRRHAEWCHGVGDNIRRLRQIHVRRCSQIKHARQTGNNLLVIPSGQRHVAHRVRSLRGRELGCRAHFARRVPQRFHLAFR